LTSISVTVPEVAKSAVAVLALCTVPLAVAVAVTGPWVTGMVRTPLAVSALADGCQIDV
jgi:hypothetical protein